MKHLLIFISLFLATNPAAVFCQEHNIHRVSYIFDPEANAQQDINDALKRAVQEHKNVFLIFGGDWSAWSRLLMTSFFKQPEVSSYMLQHNIIVKVNFSPLNKNEAVLDKYKCPRDQGYPVVIVLDEHGQQLHAENLDAYKVFAPKYTNYNKDVLISAMKSWTIH